MIGRHTSRVMIAAVLAVLVAGLPAAAAARRKKPLVKAAVNGRTISFKKNVQITGGGDTVAFFVIAQTPARLGATFRTISVACGAFPPPVVPGEGAYCISNYTETRVGRHASIKAWLNHVGETQVTFDSYDGSQIAGRFSGTMTSTTGDPPITVQGEFRGRVQLAQ